MSKGGCYWCRAVGVELEEGMCSDCAASPHETPRAEIIALRAALDQERADNEKARAALGALRAFAQHLDGFRCDRVEWHDGGFFAETDNPDVKCTCGLSALLSGRGEKESPH